MQLVLIGYGKMGKAVEKAAKDRHHEIVAVYKDRASIEKISPSEHVCIDFTSPQAFRENYKFLAEKFKASVVGTTGWDNIQEEVFGYFKSQHKTLIYGSNFSLGINIFAQLTKLASMLLAGLGGYDPYLIEMHHRQKKDAPSGTAKMLDAIIRKSFGKSADPISVRCGNIKGAHEIGYESEVDRIVLKHEAYSRKGFADGAILAAELSESVAGIWNFKELLENKFKEILQ